MTEIPIWWLVVSALFFVVNLVVLVVLAVIGLRVVKMLEESKPQLAELNVKVNKLVDTVQSTAVKVDDVASSVRETTRSVGTKASNAAGVFENASMAAAPILSKIVPGINIAMVALKVFKAFQASRAPKAPKLPKVSKK
jgi:uncharacterized protein YoxC